MVQFHRGGGGYGKNAFATLHLIDQDRLSVELALKGIRCDIPDCMDTAVAIMNTGTAPLLCASHRDAYLSDAKVAIALTSSFRAWLQYHLADIARHAYEGQDDSVILQVHDINEADSLMDKARKLLKAAREIEAMNTKVKKAAFQKTAQPVPETVKPKVRPSISTLASSNVHPGLRLFG